ncbi:ECF transporter S component [Anaerosporobacter sp.]|uniref:ECF transporter S component n=1 Tax=Anaerosporobacter sp. TaxID=1872529 RepID=UPI00286ECE96|nr:ECF transporter S component [Anaerosporobacter sp.]
MNKKKVSTNQITIIALAAVINIVGGQVALLLRLPIYLDCIGTVFIGAVLGPVFGIIPGFISCVINGITTDIYSLYFMIPHLITGMMVGLVFKTKWAKTWRVCIGTLVMAMPSIVISSGICAYLFGGVTSSGSALIVFILRKIGTNMWASVFVVQLITEYADRLLAVGIAIVVIKTMPKDVLSRIKGENRKYGAIQ